MGAWQKRLLLTGPIAQLERYAEAARSAGWEPTPFPLLTVAELDVDPTQGLDRLPDWICVTSRNAVAALSRCPHLRDVPCATVGRSSANLLREEGFRVEIEGAPSAAALVERMIEAVEPGRLVLWPRGRLATELASRLREIGVSVTAPVVYDTVARPLAEPIPDSDAVFFASPSAVEAYLEHADPSRDERRIAIGIGPTTWQALELRAGRFPRNVVLASPEPHALADELTRLLPA